MTVSINKVSYVTAAEREAGQRLDNFLIRHLKNVPKTHIYRLIRTGQVRINQKRVRQDSRLEPGDIIRIPPFQIDQTVAAPKRPDLKLHAWIETAIMFEHADFLILNKPAGISVHAGSDTQHGLIEILRAYRQDLKFLELVHRLDRATSGLLIIAKKPSSLKALHALLRAQKIQKKYQVLVFGHWPKALNRIEAPIDGKASLTTFQVLQSFKDTTLLLASLHTGRQHQIRIHTSKAGFPIVGDTKYGNFPKNRAFAKAFGTARMFLQAQQLKLTWEGQIYQFEEQNALCGENLITALDSRD